MRNTGNTKISKILKVAKGLPVFTLDDLASIETNKEYLRILLSRHVQVGTVVRLKKGLYVAKEYLNGVEKAGRLPVYAEFLTNILYEPSYLSLEYVLHQHSVITESPMTVTAVSRKKTSTFRTSFGTYAYHSIAPTLFTGFTTKRDGEYLISRASLAKALFDFLYFRKMLLTSAEVVKELRLNLNSVSKRDKIELAGYIALEGSARMKNIYRILWKN